MNDAHLLEIQKIAKGRLQQGRSYTAVTILELVREVKHLKSQLDAANKRAAEMVRRWAERYPSAVPQTMANELADELEGKHETD